MYWSTTGQLKVTNCALEETPPSNKPRAKMEEKTIITSAFSWRNTICVYSAVLLSVNLLFDELCIAGTRLQLLCFHAWSRWKSASSLILDDRRLTKIKTKWLVSTKVSNKGRFWYKFPQKFRTSTGCRLAVHLWRIPVIFFTRDAVCTKRDSRVSTTPIELPYHVICNFWIEQ